MAARRISPARPIPQVVDDDAWTAFLHMRTNPERRARGALAPHAWLRALLQRAARYRHAIRFVTAAYNAPGNGRHDPTFRTTSGGRIDRARPLAFTLRRPRAHRVRGRHAGLGAAGERRASGRALVQVSSPARHPRAGARTSRTRWSTLDRDAGRRTPNLRATQVELYDGLRAESQNRLAVARDSTLGAVNDLLAPLLPAGFYYKTFMWPACAPGTVLRAADPRAPPASGRAPTLPDPDRYAQRYAHCDVLVVGAGPAGLAAALAAAEAARASSSATSRPNSAARCWPSAAPHRRQQRRGLAAPRLSRALAPRRA